MNEFKNIPSTGIQIVEIEREGKMMKVDFLKRATVSFSVFSLIQLLCGAILHLEEYPREKSQFDQLDLYFRLSKFIFGQPNHDATFNVELTYKEIVTLKKWLEVRMQHCEFERDQRSDKFNPDTYIAQKYLLLDLKILLTGEIYWEVK